jgi:cobalt-zinc-cadmium efflux system protein
MPEPPGSDAFLDEVCHELREHFRIDHITIQIEHGDAECHQAPAHAV